MSKRKEQLIVQDNGNWFSHGEIIYEKPGDYASVEVNVEIEAELTIADGKQASFKYELQELIKKYAL